MKKDSPKPSIQMITPEESLGISSEEWNEIVDECIYGDDEQEPGWSEKDEKMIDLLIAIFEVNYPNAIYKINMQGIYSSEIVKWLKNFKRIIKILKPQTEQEWSKLDESHLTLCIECVEECAFQDHEDLSKTISWLETLKGRMKGEAIKAVEIAIEKMCWWLKENKDHPFIGCEDPCLSGFLTDEFIECFKRFMKGE